MSLFGVIGSLFAGDKKKKAVGQAAQAQTHGLQQGIDRIGAQHAETMRDLAPWTLTGREALGAQKDLLGLGAGGAQGQQAAIQALQDSPLFKSLFGAGEEAILSNGAATGGLRGGNIQRSLADFGSDTLAQVIQRQLANLGGLSAQGLGSTVQGANYGADVAKRLEGLFGGQGDVTASGILGQTGAEMQGLNGALSAIMTSLSSLGSIVNGGGGIQGGGKMF